MNMLTWVKPRYELVSPAIRPHACWQCGGVQNLASIIVIQFYCCSQIRTGAVLFNFLLIVLNQNLNWFRFICSMTNKIAILCLLFIDFISFATSMDSFMVIYTPGISFQQNFIAAILAINWTGLFLGTCHEEHIKLVSVLYHTVWWVLILLSFDYVYWTKTFCSSKLLLDFYTLPSFSVKKRFHHVCVANRIRNFKRIGSDWRR